MSNNNHCHSLFCQIFHQLKNFPYHFRIKRLQRLINQLMEFRKINTGNMKLNIEKGEIIGFVRAIYNDLYTVAKQKDVTMNFTPWTQPRDALRPGKGGNHRV